MSEYAPFNNIPPEILLKIFSHVPSANHLALKLVSKDFHAYAHDAFRSRVKRHKFATVCRCHTAVEAHIPRGRALTCCICTNCGSVRDVTEFTDAQARKVNPKRICIPCGIAKKKYTEKVLPKVNGVTYIPCWKCKKAGREFKDWRELLSLARWRFRPSRTATIAENLAMQTGAYCEPCLEEMLGFPVAKLHAEFAACSAAFRGALVTKEKLSLKDIILHGVTLGNGPGLFRL